jgi:hypothetical protein
MEKVQRKREKEFTNLETHTPNHNRTQTKTVLQATKITGMIETISESPNPAYSGRIENFTNEQEGAHKRSREVSHDPVKRALGDCLDALVDVR